MEYLVAVSGLVVFMVALWLLNAYWQRRHRRSRPPRHQGEPQSQHGRVYKDPSSTNHNVRITTRIPTADGPDARRQTLHSNCPGHSGQVIY